jgi:uncharacterized membrane protein YphA (DoxX/SURF4 family)
MRIVGLGHGLFALAAASLAILSLTDGGRETWVYASALVVLAASAGLCFSRTALPSALTIGAYGAVLAGINVPPILAKPLSVGSWYGFCEALTWLLGAWTLYAMLRVPIAGERAVRAVRVLFGLTWVFYGWSHFVYADYTAGMVPTWLPGGLAFAYLTGLGHIAAGIGIMVGVLPRLAATLEAMMMSLFGLLVWVPSLFAQPRPKWAGTPQNQWSELLLTLLLAASAWIVADSLRNRRWGFARDDT